MINKFDVSLIRLHYTPHNLAKMILNLVVVDPDNIAKRARVTLVHGGSFTLRWLILQNQPKQIRSHQPVLKCAKDPLLCQNQNDGKGMILHDRR